MPGWESQGSIGWKCRNKHLWGELFSLNSVIEKTWEKAPLLGPTRSRFQALKPGKGEHSNWCLSRLSLKEKTDATRTTLNLLFLLTLLWNVKIVHWLVGYPPNKLLFLSILEDTLNLGVRRDDQVIINWLASGFLKETLRRHHGVHAHHETSWSSCHGRQFQN